MSHRYQPVEVILTQDELVELCAEWQERLRLQDWQIALRVEYGQNLKLSNSGACVHWTLSRKVATIQLLNHVNYPESPFPQDMEVDLVHELLHLHLAPCAAEDGTDADTAQEIAVDSIAQALVQLKREAKQDA